MNHINRGRLLSVGNGLALWVAIIASTNAKAESHSIESLNAQWEMLQENACSKQWSLFEATLTSFNLKQPTTKFVCDEKVLLQKFISGNLDPLYQSGQITDDIYRQVLPKTRLASLINRGFKSVVAQDRTIQHPANLPQKDIGVVRGYKILTDK
jgi:hypothetical protein